MQTLALAVSILSLFPTCTEVCVQTDCSKMAAAEPTGFSCAACPSCLPRPLLQVRGLGAEEPKGTGEERKVRVLSLNSCISLP